MSADLHERLADHIFIAQALLAPAIGGLWMGTGLHFVTLFPSLAPLVRMQEHMLVDVFKWLALLSVAVIGFSAASYTMYKGYDEDVSGSDTDLDCVELARRKHESIFYNMWHLSRIALGGDYEKDFDCQQRGWLDPDSVANLGVSLEDRHATGRHLLTAVNPLILTVWLIWSVVLALNMLIAYSPRDFELNRLSLLPISLPRVTSHLLARRMMSKSFEKVHGMQLLHIRAIFAQSTLAYEERSVAPPPLSLLMLPYKARPALFKAFVKRMTDFCGTFCTVVCPSSTRVPTQDEYAPLSDGYEEDSSGPNSSLAETAEEDSSSKGRRERSSRKKQHERPKHVSSTVLKKDVEELQKKMDDEVQRRLTRIKEEEHVAEEIRSALGKVRSGDDLTGRDAACTSPVLLLFGCVISAPL